MRRRVLEGPSTPIDMIEPVRAGVPGSLCPRRSRGVKVGPLLRWRRRFEEGRLKVGYVGLALAVGLTCALAACSSSSRSSGESSQPVQFSGALTERQGQVRVGEVSLQAGEGLRWWAKVPDDAGLNDNLQFAHFDLTIVHQTGLPAGTTSIGRNSVKFSTRRPLPIFYDFDHSNQWYDGNQALAGVWMTFVAPSTDKYDLEISLHLNALNAGKVPYTGAYSTHAGARNAVPVGFSPAQWTAAVDAQLHFLYGQSNFWPLSGFSFYESASSGGGCTGCASAPPPPPPKPEDVGPQAHTHQARQAVGGG